MKRLKNMLIELYRNEEGQDLVEYSLLLVLMVLAAVTTLGELAKAVNGVFTNAAANLTAPT